MFFFKKNYQENIKPWRFCVDVRISKKWYIHTYIHTYIRTYIHAYIHTYITQTKLKELELCIKMQSISVFVDITKIANFW